MHPNNTANAAISGGGGSGRINADELHQMDSVDLEGVVGLEDLGDFGGDVGQFDSLMDGRGGGFSAGAVPQRVSQARATADTLFKYCMDVFCLSAQRCTLQAGVALGTDASRTAYTRMAFWTVNARDDL